ncbi:MAG: UTP--glucose-1-phosphate uridylyltransferase [Bacilli bacterium]|nr:UTP--glucose-1-phosphate uridylyltransferase [Bacilli bacterium]
MSQKVRKAVIPVAGAAIEFLPVTKGIPKGMMPIIDKPLLLYQVEEAVASGIEEVIIVVNKGREAIEKFFEREPMYENYLISKKLPNVASEIRKITTLAKYTFVYQSEQRGLGHAILQVKDAVGDEPFLIILGDDIIMNEGGDPASLQVIKAYEKLNAPIIGVQEVSENEVSKYGIIEPQKSQGRYIKVRSMVEKPVKDAPSRYAALGRYVITPDIFNLLKTTIPGLDGEIQLTDALRRQKNLVAYNFVGKRYDVGTRVGYLEAVIDIALHRDDMKDALKEYIKNKKIED